MRELCALPTNLTVDNSRKRAYESAFSVDEFTPSVTSPTPA